MVMGWHHQLSRAVGPLREWERLIAMRMGSHSR